MIGEVKKYKLFFVVSFFVLFLSFAFNIFGAVTTDSFISSYKDSESLVTNEIRCGGKVYSNQLLEIKSQYAAKSMNTCDEAILNPYSSQFGLQGKLYTAGFNFLSNTIHLSAGAYIVIAQLLTAIFSSLVFSLFVLWVRSNFNFITSCVSLIMIAISPMVVGFSRNLYWALPLFILPLVFVLYYYRLNMSRKYSIFFWFLLGLLLYLRYLCGYEYITTITIMIASTMSYFLFVSRAKLKKFITQFILIGFVSIIAFSMAIVTHVGALNSYTGSTGKSISIIMQRAEERTINSDKYIKYPYMNLNNLANDYYRTTNTYLGYEDRLASGSKLWSAFAAFSNYMLLPVFHLPLAFTTPFSLYAQSFIVFVLILLLIYVNRKKWAKGKLLRKMQALYLSALLGVVGFFSWLLLAFSHSLVHAHINGILIYLPFALFGYIILGLFIDCVIKKFTRASKINNERS